MPGFVRKTLNLEIPKVTPKPFAIYMQVHITGTQIKILKDVTVYPKYNFYPKDQSLQIF